MRRLLLASLALAVLLPRISAADEQADARAILEKAIKAQGDEAAMGKVVAFHATLEAESYGLDIGFLSRAEVFQEGLDKMRVVMSTSAGNTVIAETYVINGKQGWIKRDRVKTTSMSEADLASLRGTMYVGWLRLLVPLRKAEYRLSQFAETTVAGRKVIGILVRHDKQDAVKLYFDKETHLLTRFERQSKDAVEGGSERHEETALTDYRTVKGFKLAYKEEKYRDGRKCEDAAFLKLEFSEKPFDDKLFAEP